ncbi:MAG TPA: YetF domain-containing protein [Gemmatimonadaceae bacterium]|nr:YetF domain-containing protein [Gemmatimonadaceae bacterium]
MDTIQEGIGHLLGLGRDIGDLAAWQMALRTIVIYVCALAIVRFGSKRFLSRASAFDVIVAIMLGSIMSSAINGSAPFVPTIVAGAVLVGMHWLLAHLAARLDWFGPLVKGHRQLLIRDGEIQEEGLRKSGLSRRDLEQHLRLEHNTTDMSTIERAYMERSGKISVVPAERSPRATDVSVRDGVLTVRVELD